jgi:proteasome accessory factor C
MSPAAPPRTITSAERLRRLLALVPYVAARRVVGLAETAATFGMSERELIDDLNLAWCVELRAPEPYCPIDLSYEDGEVSISQAESIARPLRLAAEEASALLIALRTLAETASLGQDQGSEAVARVIAKIEGAAGGVGAPSSQVTIQIENPKVRGMAATLSTALAARKRVHLRYYVPSRDQDTERDVDPMRMLAVEGHTYLEGWCRLAEGVRLFRVDRVMSADVLDADASVPADAEPVDVDAGLFRPSESDVVAELELGPGARWVTDYYPCETVTEARGPARDGWLRIALRTPDLGWVRRLALRLGDDARVVAPASLAAEVRAAAAAALAHYED